MNTGPNLHENLTEKHGFVQDLMFRLRSIQNLKNHLKVKTYDTIKQTFHSIFSC